MHRTKLARLLILAIAVVLILSVTSFPALASSTFPDVPANAPYANELRALAEAGVFRGDANGNFNPDRSMTRAEAAVLMVRLYVDENVDTSRVTHFTDVPSSHWAYEDIRIASAAGLISGYGDGRFGPNDAMTYNQALALLLRAMGYGPMAEAWGGWSHGYILAGNVLGLSDRTASTGDSAVPRSTVAVLIYNALYNIGRFDGGT